MNLWTTLAELGSKSGRDMDKMHVPGLTPVTAHGTVSFEEAEVTLICQKLFKQQLDAANMPEDVVKDFYADQDMHDMYIGKVVFYADQDMHDMYIGKVVTVI